MLTLPALQQIRSVLVFSGLVRPEQAGKINVRFLVRPSVPESDQTGNKVEKRAYDKSKRCNVENDHDCKISC